MVSLKNYATKNIKGYSDSNDIDVKNFKFDKEDYLSVGYDIPRSSMPQIDWKEFKEILPILSKIIPISAGYCYAKTLKPTQNEINIDKVMKKIAKGKKVDPDYVFIMDMNYHIIDGHHKHVQLLMTCPDQEVAYVRFEDKRADELVYMFTKLIKSARVDINDQVVESILESYGAQGPEAVPGMGAVVHPNVSTNVGQSLDSANRGSGDYVSISKKKELDEENYTKSYLKDDIGDSVSQEEWDRVVKTVRQNVLDIPLDENHPLADIMDLKI